MSEIEKGLLGDLPKRRPGVETPRRTAAREQRQTRPAAAQDAPAEAPDRQLGGSGFGQLARAGLGLAGGTAAAGLRLAERAVSEIGRAATRR